jgi:hypothetical protein
MVANMCQEHTCRSAKPIYYRKKNWPDENWQQETLATENLDHWMILYNNARFNTPYIT